MPLVPCFNCNPNNTGAFDVDCPYCSGKGQLAAGEDTVKAMDEAAQAHAHMPPPDGPPQPAFAVFERSVSAIFYADGIVLALALDGTLWAWDTKTSAAPDANWIRVRELPRGEL